MTTLLIGFAIGTSAGFALFLALLARAFYKVTQIVDGVKALAEAYAAEEGLTR